MRGGLVSITMCLYGGCHITHPVMIGFSKDAEICGLILLTGEGHGWVLAWVTMDQPQRNGISSLNARQWTGRGEGPETVWNWLSLIHIHSTFTSSLC